MDIEGVSRIEGKGISRVYIAKVSSTLKPRLTRHFNAYLVESLRYFPRIEIGAVQIPTGPCLLLIKPTDSITKGRMHVIGVLKLNRWRGFLSRTTAE